MYKLMEKKIFGILCSKSLPVWTYVLSLTAVFLIGAIRAVFIFVASPVHVDTVPFITLKHVRDSKSPTPSTRECYDIIIYPGIQFRLPCTPPRTIFHGCQIVHWDPLDGKRRCPQKNFGLGYVKLHGFYANP